MKNKGFTLTEMLGVISLLGILVVVVLISVSKLLKTSNEKYYKTQEAMMVLAAKEYFGDYRSYLPVEVNKDSRVVLSNLISEEYLGEVVDVQKEQCDILNSYVKVVKEDSENYRYEAYLSCPNTNYKTVLREQ